MENRRGQRRENDKADERKGLQPELCTEDFVQK